MKITVNGLTLNYAERGMPNGLPVVFIHGFPFNHTLWDPQMMALPNDVRAITYDVRGHGQSDVADGHYSIEFFVDDLAGLLDHLGIRQAVLCGLSMGGYIALRAVERNPERVRGLVLCDTRSDADTNEGKVKRSAAIRTVKEQGVEAFAEGFLKAVFAPASLQRLPETVARVRSMIVGNSPLGICSTLLALAARTDTTGALAAVDVPTLICVGEHDQLTPPAAARSLHEKIRGSRLEVLPDAAHLSNLENTDSFNRHLNEFLKQL